MIVILGGGPAGSAAGIVARQYGSEVLIVEKSKFPKHKVCGEFLSPEALPLLDRLGVVFPEAAKIRRVVLRFARTEKSFALPEAAIGISRYLLDHRLLSRARDLGATVGQEGPSPSVIATGRQSRGVRGQRLFGFKTHVTGPATDAVELYFFDGGYVGLNQIEGGRTNVCGLFPEAVLARVHFEIDDVLARFEPLRERLFQTSRVFPWLKTGPLVFGRGTNLDGYPCGDALHFVDPFTGSGLLAALATGSRAGSAAVRQEPLQDYLKDCSRILSQPNAMSSVLRCALRSWLAEALVPLIPGKMLFRLTRPRA